MRRILFLFCILIIISPQPPGQTMAERVIETFYLELTDEVWPNLWLEDKLYWVTDHQDYSPNHETIDQLGEKGIDSFTDAVKEMGVNELEKWKPFFRLRNWLKDRAELKLAVYQQESAENGPSKLTIDTGWKVDKGRHHILDAGIRLRNQPALYLKYHWLNNGRLKHDWAWYPTRQMIEYRLDEMPLNLDIRIDYQYDDRVLRGKIEDWQITEQWRLGVSVSYDLDDCDLSTKAIFYATF